MLLKRLTQWGEEKSGKWHLKQIKQGNDNDETRVKNVKLKEG